jgi:hypothetical protein
MPHRFTAENEAQWLIELNRFSAVLFKSFLRSKTKTAVVGPGEMGNTAHDPNHDQG